MMQLAEVSEPTALLFFNVSKSNVGEVFDTVNLNACGTYHLPSEAFNICSLGYDSSMSCP